MNEKFKQLLKKAEEGDLLSQYELALGYFSGEATGKTEVSKGIEWIDKFGNSGNAEIKCICGKCFKEMEWYPEAVSWYKKAANEGSIEAMAELAAFYLYGIGCSKNEELALSFAQKAFKKGEKNLSPMILAILHLQGNVIEQNVVDAYKYLKIATENGNEEAPAMVNQLETLVPQLRNL